MSVKPGARFKHKYWTDERGNPLTYQVTVVRNGWVFVRPVGGKTTERVWGEDFARVYGGAA